MSASIAARESTATVLSSKHCRAICEGIGERLALVLRPTTELPPRLKELLDQLALLDHDAPSIAPDIEDMAMPQAVFLAYG
jgi:hypothetical protein